MYNWFASRNNHGFQISTEERINHELVIQIGASGGRHYKLGVKWKGKGNDERYPYRPNYREGVRCMEHRLKYKIRFITNSLFKAFSRVIITFNLRTAAFKADCAI